MAESWVIFDGPDGCTKGWISSNLDVPVTKKSKQGDGTVIIRAGILNQTIIGPFKLNEGIKLYNVKYCNFMDKTLYA